MTLPTLAQADPVADPPRWRTAGPVLELGGLVAMLSALLLKASVAFTTFPGWDFDPFAFPSPSAGIGPAGCMWCDALALLGATCVLVARCLAGAPLRALPALLGALGMLGVALHSWPPIDHTVGDTFLGSSWGVAMLAGLVVFGTPRGEEGRRARAILTAVLVGFVALLAVRAVQQVFIEHPATVSEFRRNKAQVFAAQGWSPESPMAKAYERRILQPEATGWFGLANVLATFGAAGTLAGAGLVIAAFRARRESPALLLPGAIMTFIAGAGTVVLAGGKGGYAATILGLGVLVAFSIARGRPRTVGGVFTLGALGATMALVVAASRTEQLSLLFRWFYAQAAWRIGLSHLPTGVGPDGFQAAYMLAKNPLSPEDVTSSHNVLLDWFSTLGLFGLAWCILWCAWIWRAGVRGVETAPEPPAPDFDTGRVERWCVAAIGTAATVGAVRIDEDIMTPDAALTRLAGLIAFVLAGWLTLSLLRRDSAGCIGRALAAGSVAAGAHALIDVTGVWPSSAGMLMVVVALGGSGVELTRRRSFFVLLPSVAVSTLALALVAPLVRVSLWEGELRSTAADAARVGSLAQRWSEIREDLRLRRPGASERARDLAIELTVPGAQPPTSAEALEQTLHARDEQATRAVAERLEKSLLASYPLDWRVRREASRLWIRAAAFREQHADQSGADAAREHAINIAAAAPPGSETASGLAWLSLALESRATGPDAKKWLADAATALERASKLSPYELAYATRLMDLWDRAGDRQRALQWVLQARSLDAGMKYDREVKGMTPEERARATRISGGS